MTAIGGGCLACKMPKRTGDMVLDTGIDIEMEGSVQFCGACVAFWNGVMGGITPDLQAEMHASLARMATELHEANKHLLRLREKEAAVEAKERELTKMLAIGRGLDGEVRKIDAIAAKASA